MIRSFTPTVRTGVVSVLLMGLALFFGTESSAQEGVHTSIHHQYQSPRAMGMGGAFVAVANDYSAVLYNPAGLARFEKWYFNGSMDIGLSAEQFLGFTQQLDQASKIENENDRFNATVEVLQKNYGKQFSTSAGLLHGSFVTTNWGLHVIPADFTLDMRVHNQGTPAINVRAFMDTTIAYGYGRAFASEHIPGRFSWGVTSKLIHRGYANKQVNALDLSVDPEVFKSSDLRDGITLDFDLGLLYTPALPGDGIGSIFRMARPTFGVVLRNVFDYGFDQVPGLLNKTDMDAPEKLHRTVDFGTRFELPPFSIFSWRAVADVQDVMHPNYSFRKALHMGAEFDWTLAGWWKGQYRMGVNQGYPTLGASFLLAVFRLDLLSYGEDIGGPNSARENRMYKIVFNLDI